MGSFSRQGAGASKHPTRPRFTRPPSPKPGRDGAIHRLEALARHLDAAAAKAEAMAAALSAQVFDRAP